MLYSYQALKKLRPFNLPVSVTGKQTPCPGKRGKIRVDAFWGNKHVTLVILSSCGRCAAVLHSSQVPHNVSRKTSVQFKLELRKDFWTI